MTKIFLSHSSKDKVSYVEPVYKRLCSKFGKSRVIIDEFSFEEGRKTVEEIELNISQSDLIVLFLSSDALNSTWVQKEYELAKKMMQERTCQVCPLIITDDLFYDDVRIPDWLRNDYNIQKITSTRKAADIISERLYEIISEKNPKLALLNSIFVGRNDFLNILEERLDDFSKECPRVLIASGISGVGRKTFLRRGVIKSTIVKESFSFPEISLNYVESIEDFILKLSDLGFSPSIEFPEIITMTLEQKIKKLVGVMKILQDNHEIVVIRDEGCIINHEGAMSEWFCDAISSFELENTITFLVTSKFKYIKNKSFESYYFDIALPELSMKERSGLLNRLLTVEEIDISSTEKESIAKLLSGYPKQIHYAVRMLKELGLERFDKERYKIIDFGSKNAVLVLNDIQSDIEKMNLLVLLCKFDYIDKALVYEIIENETLVSSALEKFYVLGICDYLGVAQEYIRVNDIIKDYIVRSNYEIPKKYTKKIAEIANKKIVTEEYEDEISLPQMLFSLKNSLLKGEHIDEKLIIPSVYLSTMNELYHSKKYAEVIRFADKALERESFMEKNIIFELRYLLCLALAQQKQPRFTTEVQKIAGADHNFLFGFYYRKLGKFDAALERYDESLKERPSFSKAKREKVQVLIGMQDYEAALNLAKLNYENYTDNPYHIQAYFSCLIKGADPIKSKDLLCKLIDDMDLIHSKIAEEMTVRLKAQYEAFINHRKEKGIELIDKAITMDESLPYARMIKFDIAERFADIDMMREILNFFDTSEQKNKISYDTITYMKSVVMLFEERKLQSAKDFFVSNIKNYTENAKNQVLLKLDKIYAHIA